jgi:beta-catenin-like protein 1
LGILVSLFTNLASDTPPRIRLIAKFVEGEYEKVERLLEMREAAETRLRVVDRDIHQERRVSGLSL